MITKETACELVEALEAIQIQRVRGKLRFAIVSKKYGLWSHEINSDDFEVLANEWQQIQEPLLTKACKEMEDD